MSDCHLLSNLDSSIDPQGNALGAFERDLPALLLRLVVPTPNSVLPTILALVPGVDFLKCWVCGESVFVSFRKREIGLVIFVRICEWEIEISGTARAVATPLVR